MTTHRIATFSIGGGSAKYGAVIEGGIVDLSARFGKDFPTLREAAERSGSPGPHDGPQKNGTARVCGLGCIR